VGLPVLCRRSPAALTGLLWIVLCAVEILPLQKVSSRYLYLLSVGYPLLGCGLIAHPEFPRLSPGMRRTILGLGGLTAGLLAAANIVFVQREIADYRLLAAPYRACFESLRGEASALAPGETLIVAETEPRTAIRDLTVLMEERGNIRKLIPERDQGVGGLIALPDLINAVRPARTGSLAVAADQEDAGPRRILLWDGRTARPADALPDPPPARVLAAKLVPSAAFFEPAAGPDAAQPAQP